MYGDGIPWRSVCVALLLATFARSTAADAPDLTKIERRIAKGPSYTAKQPLYGLYVFGPEAKTHVWAIFDKSKPDALDYDILYFDRNADGDLTASAKRIAGKSQPDGMHFDIGSFTDPLTKQNHTELSIRRQGGDAPMVMLQMKWCGRVVIRGGYAPDVGPYTQFATTPEKAPVLWVSAEGPLSFQFWQLSPLKIGESDEVRVFLGHQGLGRNTFCALPDTFLPSQVPVHATLVYRDGQGKEQRARSELRERC